MKGASAFDCVVGKPLKRSLRRPPLSEAFLVNPPTPPPEGGTTGAGLPAQPAGVDPFRQYELYHLAKISDRMETVVVLLTFIMLATLFTALLLFLSR